MRGKKSQFQGEFTLTFSLTFSLTFTLTFTLDLQIDGASSRSIERHFYLDTHSCLDVRADGRNRGYSNVLHEPRLFLSPATY